MKTLNGLRDKEQIYSSSHRISQDTGKEKMPSLLLPAFPRTLPTLAASSHSLQILQTPTTSLASPSRLFLPHGRAWCNVAHGARGFGTRRCWHSPIHHLPGMLLRTVFIPGQCSLVSSSPGHEDRILDTHSLLARGRIQSVQSLALKTSQSKSGWMLTVGLGETCQPPLPFPNKASLVPSLLLGAAQQTSPGAHRAVMFNLPKSAINFPSSPQSSGPHPPALPVYEL